MNLIVFYNGWGMDASSVEQMQLEEGYDLCVVNFPYKTPIISEKYEKVIAIGYSFGAYYLAKSDLKANQYIAINGSHEMIGKCGINQKIFDSTLENLSLSTLNLFYANMSWKNPQTNKSFDQIKAELAYFKEHYQAIDFSYDFAYLSRKDRITPAKKLAKSFTHYQCIETGHYPFDEMKKWSDFIGF